MIDLNKPLDLKNINAETFLKDLLKQKATLFKIAIFMLAAASLGLMVTNFFKEKTSTASQMAMLQEKLEVIGRYKQSKTEFDQFLDARPKYVEENSLVNTLSDFAVQQNVEVSSFSGVQVQSNAYFDVYSVDMDIHVGHLKEALILVRAIENSSNALRLESFEVNKIDAEGMQIKLRISTIKTKVS